MRSRLPILAVCTLSVAFALPGCGGASDNGIASKSPDQIANLVTDAASTVKSVHVAGSIVNGGSPITLDLNLVSSKGGGGQMSQSGLSFQIISLDQLVYLNGSAAFWRHFGGQAA